MVASIREVLSTKITSRAVSQVAASTNLILNTFGMQPGGAAERRVGHRQAGYDIFNNARSAGMARAPGTPAAVRRRQAVGRVDFTFPRMAEALPLLAEELHNQRRIGGPNNEFDEAGVDYIRRQQRYMGQIAANFRAMLLGGMLRGKLYVHVSGDDLYYDYTSTSALYTLDYQMPSGNKDQLNMNGGGNLISGSWASSSTNIPSDLANINAGFQQLYGGRLDICMCQTSVWQQIVTNDFVVAEGGAFATPFESFTREVGVGPDGTPLNQFRARLRCSPWIEWIISDEGLTLGVQGSETFTKLLPSNGVIFMPTPNADLYEMQLGSEPISEGPNMDPIVRMGLHSWTTPSFNPSGYTLFTNDNCLPTNYVPNSMAFGTVVY